MATTTKASVNIYYILLLETCQLPTYWKTESTPSVCFKQRRRSGRRDKVAVFFDKVWYANWYKTRAEHSARVTLFTC